jgi:hypothetical protein
MEKIKTPRRQLPTVAVPFIFLEGGTTAPPRKGPKSDGMSKGLLKTSSARRLDTVRKLRPGG